ncbi:Acyl-CoA-binding protein [Cocos nucifera]|uniref:Acyl-CoA-binding protein n=1 Tax=Cocos nucifera TaxID=13894 RepID=A0A8K0N6Z3_COCNU|nr:Acyl-CoA-binding protein [Cocos nucifera]
MQEEFEEYAEKAKTLPENTTNENKLILYGLYKQATVGPVNTNTKAIIIRLHDCNMRYRSSRIQELVSVLISFLIGRPGMFNLKDRAKWDAWKAVEGKSKEDAMSDYITKVKQLQEEAAAA